MNRGQSLNFSFPIRCHHLHPCLVKFLPNLIHCKTKWHDAIELCSSIFVGHFYFPSTIPHLSNDGSLLNISVGTVAGASNIPISDCLDCKCRSTSSAVIWPSVIVSVFMMAGAGGATLFDFFCVCFRRFGGLAFLFCVAFVELFFRLYLMKNNTCELIQNEPNRFSISQIDITYFRTFSVRLPSSSDDSVSSSLSDSELYGFSYCNKRSSKNERSLVTFNRRRWLDRSASWKNSFS